ncbi:hypothetical protein RJ55_03389 [Drechmeria coniospora]|nr:hypothetical protein RJ55_03389 [Drechmeria coniospora]
MDPISIAGLSLGVASLGLQVYTGCIQGKSVSFPSLPPSLPPSLSPSMSPIPSPVSARARLAALARRRLLITALGYENDCRYLNLRLRMEQQRLFAWSETSGLLDFDGENYDRILNSNVFHFHRQTVLDLLVQIQCLFDEFTSYHRTHNNLRPIRDEDGILATPEVDAKLANFPLSARKKNFIKKAMAGLKFKSQEGWVRLRWASLDKPAFETLLAKFSMLNDGMTNILDHSLQVEIRNSVQDTNRGVLLLHHKIADLSCLVLALKSQLDVGGQLAATPMSKLERQASVNELTQLSKLAKFKAFSETVYPTSGRLTDVDVAAVKFLELANPTERRSLQMPRYLIELDPEADDWEVTRCEALLKTPEGKKKVWIEWKDYDGAGLQPHSLSKKDIVDRVRKLASLLHHGPKPEAFRTPHCVGFFDKANPDISPDEVEILDRRLGLVFERPDDDRLHASLPPVSLHHLLRDGAVRKPRVTERIKLAHSLGSCVLYLHAVNWLHKGLRSHNVLFFRTRDGHVDYRQPCLSGFDFSRPCGSDEMTDAPGDDLEHDLYRHPLAQTDRRRERERSKKSFDVYSLGVIFVELAHWKTIDGVLDIDMRRARGGGDVVGKVRERLLEETMVADIGGEMGEQFEEATRVCLEGGKKLGLEENDDETNDEVAERLSVRYYEDVVKKLGAISV